MNGQVSPHLPGSLDYNKTSRQLLPSFFLPSSFRLTSFLASLAQAVTYWSLTGSEQYRELNSIFGARRTRTLCPKKPQIECQNVCQVDCENTWEISRHIMYVCQIRCQERLAELEFMSERIVGIFVKQSTHFQVSHGCLSMFIYLVISQNRKLNPLDHRITDNY